MSSLLMFLRYAGLLTALYRLPSTRYVPLIVPFPLDIQYIPVE